MHADSKIKLFFAGCAEILSWLIGRIVVPLLLAALGSCTSHAGNLVIESWRTDDIEIWNKKILPAFHKEHPDIRVVFQPTSNLLYDQVVSQKLRNKTAGDLITCRPFDPSLELFSTGYLLELSDKVNLKSFRNVAKAAWSTDDGSAIFCLPLAVVGHGFFYNKKIFEQLKIKPPETEAELFKLLEKIKASGKTTPIAFGTQEKWESAQIMLAAIGPNKWKGEQGRLAILKGHLRFTDSVFVETWKSMARLNPYLVKNSGQLTYAQARTMFIQEKAAIFPSGSWDINHFERVDPNKFGVFKYPVSNPGDECYVTNHLDIGIGINSASSNKKDAQVFLNWLSGKDFSDLFANTLTGFYPLSSFPMNIQSDMANEMHRWRKTCKSTIRVNSQFLNRGPESIEALLWDVSADVLNKKIKPEQASEKVQKSLDQWFYKLSDQAGQ